MSALGTGLKSVDTPAESGTHVQPEVASATPDRNDRIREIAYFLWLDEGCPEGEHERHWTNAEALLESEPEQRRESEPERRKRIEGEPPGEPVRESPGFRREARKAAV
jgi:DUF2934 family protein